MEPDNQLSDDDQVDEVLKMRINELAHSITPRGSLSDLLRRRRRQKATRWAAAAIALVVIGATIAVAANSDDRTQLDTAAVTSTNPTPPDIATTPTTTTTIAPTTTTAIEAATTTNQPDYPGCAASDLTAINALFPSGLTNQLLGSIFLTNNGASDCTLNGAPEVSIKSSTGATIDVKIQIGGRAPALGPPNKPIVLAHGGGPQQAGVQIEWFNWCQPPVEVGAITIKFAEWARPVNTVRQQGSPTNSTPGCLNPSSTANAAIDYVRPYSAATGYQN